MGIEKWTSNERRVAEDRPTCRAGHLCAVARPQAGGAGKRDCYWLYVITGCKSQACLQEPIKNPARFPWHEVKKVDHYYLSLHALTQTMQLLTILLRKEHIQEGYDAQTRT